MCRIQGVWNAVALACVCGGVVQSPAAASALRLPLAFEIQSPQGHGAVARAGGPDFRVLLTSTGARLSLTDSSTGSSLLLHLAGADPAAAGAGIERLPGINNYFIGNDPARWRTGVPTFAKIRYERVYPGIDVVYYGNGNQLEYDFVIAPRADHRRIAIDFSTAQPVRINADGDLVAGRSRIIQRRPAAYQEIGGVRRPIEVRYALRGPRRVSFALGKYDRTQPLTIDPTLAYSTYLGGSGDDVGVKMAVDNAGNAYITGHTNSASFPTIAALQPIYGGNGDAFVAKLDPTGATLVYCTYLGGSGSDAGQGIAIDGSGNAYVAGNTASADFPTTANAAQPALAGGNDVFVSVLDNTGALTYSTYLGGSRLDVATAIAVDGNSNAYVTGYTQSADFPTTGGVVQAAPAGGDDAFVTQISSAGAIGYSTYIGGSALDIARGIAVDSAGNAFIAGYTQSTDFPVTAGVLQGTYGGGNVDGFVVQLNANATALTYATFIGGSADDYAFDVAVDSSGQAFVVGNTNSINFPVTAGAAQAANAGGVDGFASALDPAAATLIYSTYMGGAAYDTSLSVAVDADGAAYVTGYTQSPNFPTTPGAYQPASAGGTSDAFVAQLTAAGALGYGSYLGGSALDAGYGIGIDGAGTVHVTGYTTSSNFPTTPGTVQPLSGGGSDAFVAAIPAGAFDEIFRNGFE